MIAVFARPDHPGGYGMPSWEKDRPQNLRAHGYVVALVKVKSEGQLAEVKQKLERDGLPEPYGHTYQWYGGKLDLIALLPGNRILGTKKVWLPVRPRNEKQSIGDNRYAGLYDAEELLDAA